MSKSTQFRFKGDPLGRALMEYLDDCSDEYIVVSSPDFDDDIILVEYLFREPDKMPATEQTALTCVKGHTLDVGAGAGSHTLYLQKNGYDVTAIDTSHGAVEAMKRRGIQHVVQSDIFDFEGDMFDTILLLMNGIGVSGDPKGYKHLLKKLDKILHKNGQILFDTSDIKYIFDKPLPRWRCETNENYYGIIQYQMSYKDTVSEPFNWLYLDSAMASRLADEAGYAFQILMEDEHYGYLIRLTRKE